MRSKRLRKREDSFIKAKEETAKKRIRWSKYVYLAVLLLIGATLGQWTFERLFYMSGMGFLEAETTFVESRTTGRIKEIKCNINDLVSEGQPLVLLGNSFFVSSAQIELSGVEYLTERKIIDLEGKLNLLRQRIFQKKETINELKNENQRAKELIAIDAITRSQLFALEDKLKRAQNDLIVLQIELGATTKKLQSYKNQSTYDSGQGGNPERILYAPATGTVSTIFKQKGEVAKTGEAIIKIINEKNNFVKAYFSGAYEKSIREGDEAKVCFENGETSGGVIRKIYPTALSHPSGKRSKFGVAKRSLIAEIVPKDSPSWDRIIETEVKVLVKRKWIPDLGF